VKYAVPVPTRLVAILYTGHIHTCTHQGRRKIRERREDDRRENSARSAPPEPKAASLRMSRGLKLRCARGTSCYHVRKLNSEQPATVAHEGDLCEKCRGELAGGYESSNTSHWMEKVITAIETVFVQRPTPQRPHKAVLWDLFDLDSSNGGWKKYSDRGAVLGRLDAGTLCKLRDWLEEQKHEAIERYDERQYKNLHNDVSLMAALSSLPPDIDLSTKGQGTGLPLDAVAYYTRSGTSRDLSLPILAAQRAEELRQQRRHVTEREIEQTIEEEFGIARTTQKRWSERMKEVGMTWYSFTSDQLEYVALGKPRGPRKSKSEGSSEE
jgi:hypothetical protein